jgi:hypothetical protein
MFLLGSVDAFVEGLFRSILLRDRTALGAVGSDRRAQEQPQEY